MSLSGGLSGISFSGIGSGIDTDSIVSRLMQIERIPLQRFQIRRAEAEARRSLYSELNSRAKSLVSSLAPLKQSSSFNVFKATSSDATVATITATNSAAAGSFQLEVSRLAQAHRVTSGAQNSTAALGYLGSFTVNGKAIAVEATDTLSGVASKINGAGAGVTASVINGSNGQSYLSLSTTNTGAASKISLGDLSGNALTSLGLLNGSTTTRHRVGNDSFSTGFADATSTLGSLSGSTQSGSFELNGININVDFSTDSLTSLASSINSAGAPFTATVESFTEAGVTKQRLKLTGDDSLIVDTSGILENLGILQQGFNTEVVAAQDASFELDGIAMTSSSNTVSTAVTGVTFTLLAADNTIPKTTTLTIAKDDDKIVETIKGFTDAFNAAIDYIRTNSEFDAETFDSGPLFGDALARQMEDTLTQMVFNTRPGAGTGDFTDLTQIGFTRSADGKLTLDETKLRSQLSSKPDGVKKLFNDVGAATGTDLTFITAGSKTANLVSGALVNITQLATQQTTTGAARLGTMGTGETLSFSGTLFGSQNISFDVSSGQTLAQVADALNADSRLNAKLVASVVADQLVFTSKSYGTPGAFTVVSNRTTGTDNTGIGDTPTVVAGLDIAGTIAGEAATGAGQLLTGNDSNLTTAGIQLRYTGTTLGNVGNVDFSRGLAGLMSRQTETYSDFASGLITANDKALEDRIKDIDLSISNFEAQLQLREKYLREKFLAMERAISLMQSQGSQLSAISGSAA